MLNLTTWFPVADFLANLRVRAGQQAGIRPEAMGCVIVLGNGMAAGFIHESMRTARGRMRPFMSDLTSELGVVDGMRVVHRASAPTDGGIMMLPQNVPALTQVDADVLRGIYGGLARGAA